MAAKDADLATDYAGEYVYLNSGDVAAYEIVTLVAEQDPFHTLYLVNLGEFVTGITYRMRGYDTTLASTVFWNSSTPDADSSDYGGPGPVTDIVVRAVSGE
jgi:hypothetical protein